MNTWMLDGPYPDQTHRMIYELDGDTLKVCIIFDLAKERPTDFTCEAGSHRLLLVYQRRKP